MLCQEGLFKYVSQHLAQTIHILGSEQMSARMKKHFVNSKDPQTLTHKMYKYKSNMPEKNNPKREKKFAAALSICLAASSDFSQPTSYLENNQDIW